MMMSFAFCPNNFFFFFFRQFGLFLQLHAEYFVGVAWVSANGDVPPSASKQNEFSVF